MTRPRPAVTDPPPARTGAVTTAPASYAQERAWLASRLTHDPPTYCAVDEFPVHADITENDLVDALAVLMERHEPLRTVLRSVHGRLTQYVHARLEPDVERLDLSAYDHAAQTEERRSLRAQMARSAFDPRRAPLWRAAVLKLGEGAWSVLFAAHHTVYDTASRFNVHAELTELCAATEEGRAPRLPDLPFGYGEYARRERQRLTPGRHDALAAHWRARLHGLPPVHTLPLDRPRPPARSFRGAEVRTALPVAVTAALTAAARHHGTRPVMLFLTAWTVLLHHHSGADDLAVGLPVAGRTEPGTRSMVGTFVNMRVLRADLTGDPDVTELVRRTAAAVREGERHDIPLQTLVALLPTRRLPGVPPLYQLAFNHVPTCPLGAPVSSCEEDLLLDVADDTVRVVYDVALFDRSTADILLADYLRLLATVLEAPGTRLSALRPAARRPSLQVLGVAESCDDGRADLRVGGKDGFDLTRFDA
ncbi:condensation domain-containing protein, partial [Streptomyces tauricus]|uniref:condensation domain-containing protein n=1 Tax=Streptomyces tauricus TaxID=68274 RepID=UPI0033B90DF7